jgi:hypothetical protein
METLHLIFKHGGLHTYTSNFVTKEQKVSHLIWCLRKGDKKRAQNNH